MKFGSSYLGSRGDFLFDTIVLSLIVIVPLLIISYSWAKNKKYSQHKSLQLILAGVLTVVLLAFETDLRMSGGIDELTKGSRYAGTLLFNTILYVHLCFAFSTAALWVGLIAASLKKFDSPPRPNSFSRMHRIWGTIALLDMVGTAITGVLMWVFGLVL